MSLKIEWSFYRKKCTILFSRSQVDSEGNFHEVFCKKGKGCERKLSPSLGKGLRTETWSVVALDILYEGKLISRTSTRLKECKQNILDNSFTGSQQTGNQLTGSQQTESQHKESQLTGSQQTGSQHTGSQQTGSQQTGSQQLKGDHQYIDNHLVDGSNNAENNFQNYVPGIQGGANWFGQESDNSLSNHGSDEEDSGLGNQNTHNSLTPISGTLWCNTYPFSFCKYWDL